MTEARIITPDRAAWPVVLPVGTWSDTRDTVHMWTQIVGKIRLELEPMVNHWWQVPLYVSARGLTTSVMPYGMRGLEVEFDFLDHVLAIRVTDGQTRSMRLDSMSVADFYDQLMDTLSALGTPVRILARPVEIPVAIPFAEDTEHHTYDAAAMHTYWLSLVQAERVLQDFRSRFIGKASPVHFFWGAFDLAATRFSGRTAPLHPGGAPNCPDWVMQRAYSHEVSSCGYWPGGADEGAFYSYAYPEPDGYRDRQVEDGHYDEALGEFLLPYRAVREAVDPDALLLRFLQQTYEAAADLAHWDRDALEAGRADGPG